MPYDDPDPSDPMTLHGVGVETSDDQAMIDMAACFIEEYARLGFDAERVMHMFRTEGYAGPALARRVLGDEAIRRMVEAEMAKWGPRPPGRLETLETSGGLSLPVLQ